MDWLKNGVSIGNQSDCFTFIEMLEDIDFSDEGRYECRATFANGTIRTQLAGTMHVIGKLASKVTDCIVSLRLLSEITD